MSHTHPKLHNAMWPGLVGKEAGTDHPPISLDRMLELTSKASVNGQKYEGVDLFLFHPHTDPDASDDDIKAMADKIAGFGLNVGSLVAPVWPGTVGASAMGSRSDQKKFVLAVKKACRIAGILNKHGVRSYGIIRIDSATGPSEWDKNPSAGTKKIAATFREAGKVAAAHGERLAAEGEICWAGMHSWKAMLDTLEAVGMPQTVGFQADLAHTYLYLLGYNAEEHALLKPGYSEKEFWPAYTKMVEALRPWTIDFHVAQNDGSVHGTGSHDKTGRHCPADDPNGKLDIVKCSALWLQGAAERGIRHICWDGCMFPNKMLETPKTWNTILNVMAKVRDAGGYDLGPAKGKPAAIKITSTAGVPTEGKKPVRIGLIGTGFMGRTHSNGYRKVLNFFPENTHVPVLQAVCARTESAVKAFAGQWGYASYETDWREIIKRDDIDAVDICTPNNSHAEIALAAAKAGKMILCEKPLALNSSEGKKMVDAASKAKVANTVWYNYRRVPAVALAKQLVSEGRLGKVFHYRAQFLQDWTISADLPQGGAGLWRLDVKAAGSGVTGDLLAHCIDSAMWLNGPITEVSAITETFIKQRKHVLSGKVEKVGIDDACLFMCRFANGSLGLFESTRYARGHKAKDTLEINGEHASIAWDLHDQHRLQYFDHRDQGIVRGWRNIHVSDGDQPYHANWWVPGLQIGYEHTFVHQVADFMKSLDEGKPCHPTFKDALETQKVCDAVLKSGKNRKWEKTGVKDFA
ncbi:MAG: Gfo/Idh/MocA family oxidoreductase [Phycisphaeraceae bacterium]